MLKNIQFKLNTESRGRYQHIDLCNDKSIMQKVTLISEERFRKKGKMFGHWPIRLPAFRRLIHTTFV